MTVSYVYFGPLFAVVENLSLIKVFFVSEVFVIVKRVDHWGLFKFDTIFEGGFVEVEMVGGVVLFIVVSLEWADEEVVIGFLIMFEFFFYFGKSFGAGFDHFDCY